MKPATRELSAGNPFNQKGKDYVLAFAGFPAKRFNSLTEIDQKENANIVRAEGEVEWHLVYVPGLPVKADWLLIDELDGKQYKIKTPLTENDRGKSYRLIASIIE
jgi:hypothetical protein